MLVIPSKRNPSKRYSSSQYRRSEELFRTKVVSESQLDQLEARAGNASGQVPEITTIGNVIYYTEITGELAMNPEDWYYNLNVNPALMQGVIKSSDTTQLDGNRLTLIPYVENSGQQAAELAIYRQALEDKRTRYQNQSWIIRASDTFQSDYLGQGKLESVREGVMDRVKGIRESF